MAYYWRLKDIPELRDLQSGDRAKWWREAVAQSRDSRAMVIRFLAFLCTAFAANMLAKELGGGNIWVHSACMAVAIGVVAWLIECMSDQPRARRWLQANLARQMAREQRLEAK